MIIKPTVGRVVWYWPRVNGGFRSDQPLLAMVCYVWNDHMVNLTVCSHEGVWFPKTSIYLVQEGIDHPFIENFAQWMPYQQAQAKKYAEPTTFSLGNPV
jgi:hypothetical protein